MAEIRTLETRPMAVQKDVIELAEDLLARAKAGEIVELAATMVLPDGAVGTAWAGGGDYHRMLGGIETLRFRMMMENYE